MVHTIAERLASSARRSFVGRRDEIDLLRRTVGGPSPDCLVAFLHGPGGVGKSRLLEALLAEGLADVTAIRLDCREVEPTPAGLLDATGAALGIAGSADLPAIVEQFALRGRTLLVLDTYEVFGLLDTWVRQVFLPALPESTTTIIAGRDPPRPAWLVGVGWAGLVRAIRLGPLTADEAIVMLAVRGVGEPHASDVNRFARGHPLALELAAGALVARPDEPIRFVPTPEMLERLLEVFLDRLSPSERESVEASCTARRVTEPILRALLDRDSVREEYDGLARLPFVERTPDGLLLHDVVRETVGRELAQRDPEASARYLSRAARFFTAQAQRPARRLWEATADLIFLLKNPVLRDACFPLEGSAHTVEPATEGDDTAVREIIARHESAPAAAVLLAWWERHPETFAIARGPDGAADAMVQVARLDLIDPELLDADPVAQSWLEHQRRVPLGDGYRVLGMRRWLGRESGELLSPPVAACWLDVKRVYMQLRPNLARLYSVMTELDAQSPIFTPLGFAAIGQPTQLGDATHQPVWLDFGPGSVDGWLSRLIDAEVEVAEAALVSSGTDAGVAGNLSPREVDVLVLIADGLSNRGIGARLVISEKTVGRHVSNIFAKLGIHSRAQAARIAAEQRLTSGQELASRQDAN